jgi:hypothetical protein
VAQVNEQAIPFVKLNDEVRVEVPALGRTDLIGTVAAIVPQADLRARTFPVKIRLDNEIVDDVPVLKAGMYARAMLSTGAKTQATMVPKDAIVLGGPSPMVYVVTDESNAKTSSPRPVRLGVANGPWIQVVGDISAGQQVVVRGNERLQPRPQPLAIDSQLSEQQIDAQYSRKQARNG